MTETWSGVQQAEQERFWKDIVDSYTSVRPKKELPRLDCAHPRLLSETSPVESVIVV